ncbi:MAG: hypothetical protein KatS3mg110_0536 [Pirellulaceae bacterium]|nr:MAG: hypothetical protein KatS3mg110_0536 [Pirellulaceae bacterium]
MHTWRHAILLMFLAALGGGAALWIVARRTPTWGHWSKNTAQLAAIDRSGLQAHGKAGEMSQQAPTAPESTATAHQPGRADSPSPSAHDTLVLPAAAPQRVPARPALSESVRTQLRAWLAPQEDPPAGSAPAPATPSGPDHSAAPDQDTTAGTSDANQAVVPAQSQPPDAAAAHPHTGRAAEPVAPPQLEAAGGRITLRARQADIREVLEMLSRQTQLSILASPNTNGTVTATLHDVDAYTALDTLVRHLGLAWWQEGAVIFVGQPQEITQIRQAREPVLTRVYRPNYVTAAELEKLVTPLLTQGVGQATVTVSRLATSSPTKSGIAASSDLSGGDDFAGQEVLLVRDYQSVLEAIDQVVAEVDRRPRQVALEAMILSVRLNDENRRGINFELLRDRNNVRLTTGTPLTDLATINFNDGGLKFAFLDSSISAFIEALETVGDTDVIAAPRLMCLNKQRAEILIGSQLGYVSTTVTQTAATQTVQFLEVGTQLRFRPYIASDGMVRLEVHPELSTGSVRIEQGLTIPDKDVTQVTTNIMCRDGRTVIIGGLIREDLTTNVSQIPVLGDIPVAGALFRRKTASVERREIIVLITPRIVRDPLEEMEGEHVRDAFLARQENYFDKMTPFAKRQYGLRYLRLARAAWNAGDVEEALRYVNLAIHFDPQNLEATTLRQQIVATFPPEFDSVDHHLRQGLAPWDMPWKDYSRDGYPWQKPPAGPTPQVEFLEEPTPTPRQDIGRPQRSF